MRSLTLRKAALAAVVPVALGSLAACGSGSGNDSSATAADPAAPTSTPTQTDSSDGGTTTPSDGSKLTGADFLALAKEGASKITTVKVAMTGDVSGGSYTMNGSMDLTGDKPAMDISMDMSSAGLSGVEMKLVDGIMYMKIGTMTQGKYVKFDLSDPSNPLGSMSSTLDNLDPTKMMSEMSPDVFRNVTFVGSDKFGKHYHATLVTAKAPQIKGLPATATANLPKTMQYDTWVDSQGRFSKFVVSVPNFMKMTAVYTDYGTDLNITAPPASEITTMPGMSPST